MIPALRVFRHRNFARYFSGFVAAMLATMVQMVAVSWLVYRLSGSPLLLGLTAFAQFIPVLVLTPVASVIADRADQRKLLMWTQAASFAQAALLAALALTGHITVAWVIGLSLVYGVVTALDSSARNMFLLELVEGRSELPHAIALQAIAVNGARAVGPGIAGLAVAALGEAWTLALNAALFLPLLVALAFVRTPRRVRPARPGSVLQSLAQGFRYVQRTMPIRRLLLLLALLSLTAAPYQTIMPLFAREQFGGDARTLGLLLGAAGAGALASTLFLASRKAVPGLGRVVMVSSTLCAVALALFAIAPWLWLAAVCMVFVGFGMIATIASINMLMQTLPPDAMRGRVIGIFLMAAMGLIPIGSLIAGVLAELVGERAALLALALTALVGALAFIRGYPRWREHVIPMYRRVGLLQDKPADGG